MQTSTLQLLLNESQQEQMKELIEMTTEKVSNNQLFNTRQAGDLLTRVHGFILKYLVNQNISLKQLKHINEQIRNNRIPIQTESIKLLFQLSGFLL